MALDFGEHIIKGQLIVVSKDVDGNKIVRTVGPVDSSGNVIKRNREFVPIKKKRKDGDKEEWMSYSGLNFARLPSTKL